MRKKQYIYNNPFDCDKFVSEIQNSEISVAYSYVNTFPDQSENVIIEVVFEENIPEIEELSAEDITILDGLIESHDGSLPSYRLTNAYDDPRNINYQLITIAKPIYSSSGVITSIEYYMNYDSYTKVFSNLAVKEVFTYNREYIFGMVEYSITDKYWYRENNEIGCERLGLITVYEFNDARKEENRRRSKLISDAEKYISGALIVANGLETGYAQSLEFLADTKTAKDLYVDGNGVALETAINNTERVYITQEMKDTLIAIITYSIEE